MIEGFGWKSFSLYFHKVNLIVAGISSASSLFWKELILNQWHGPQPEACLNFRVPTWCLFSSMWKLSGCALLLFKEFLVIINEFVEVASREPCVQVRLYSTLWTGVAAKHCTVYYMNICCLKIPSAKVSYCRLLSWRLHKSINYIHCASSFWSDWCKTFWLIKAFFALLHPNWPW